MIANGSLFNLGMPVLISKVLPIDETVLACDIETRQEQRLLTGKQIHCMEMDRKLLVSQDLFDQILKLKPNDNSH